MKHSFGVIRRKSVRQSGLVDAHMYDDPDFSPDDLMLIRAIRRGTIGGGTILPSGIKTTKETVELGDNLEENIELVRSILDR